MFTIHVLCLFYLKDLNVTSIQDKIIISSTNLKKMPLAEAGCHILSPLIQQQQTICRNAAKLIWDLENYVIDWIFIILGLIFK